MDDSAPSTGEITRLLESWGAGDEGAFERLFPLLYPELKRIADREMRRERPGHTLQPTALVHEAFLELLGQRAARFANRSHFLAVASFVMRRILVEHARAHCAQKRGGGVAPLELVESIAADEGPWEEIEAVDRALGRLEKVDARAARVVVMRYFGGLSHEEVGAALGVSVATVKREWSAAKAWLRRELGGR